MYWMVVATSVPKLMYEALNVGRSLEVEARYYKCSGLDRARPVPYACFSCIIGVREGQSTQVHSHTFTIKGMKVRAHVINGSFGRPRRSLMRKISRGSDPNVSWSETLRSSLAASQLHEPWGPNHHKSGTEGPAAKTRNTNS